MYINVSSFYIFNLNSQKFQTKLFSLKFLIMGKISKILQEKSDSMI